VHFLGFRLCFSNSFLLCLPCFSFVPHGVFLLRFFYLPYLLLLLLLQRGLLWLFILLRQRFNRLFLRGLRFKRLGLRGLRHRRPRLLYLFLLVRVANPPLGERHNRRGHRQQLVPGGWCSISNRHGVRYNSSSNRTLRLRGRMAHSGELQRALADAKAYVSPDLPHCLSVFLGLFGSFYLLRDDTLLCRPLRFFGGRGRRRSNSRRLCSCGRERGVQSLGAVGGNDGGRRRECGADGRRGRRRNGAAGRRGGGGRRGYGSGRFVQGGQGLRQSGRYSNLQWREE
jgi:hypothetical protein